MTAPVRSRFDPPHRPGRLQPAQRLPRIDWTLPPEGREYVALQARSDASIVEMGRITDRHLHLPHHGEELPEFKAAEDEARLYLPGRSKLAAALVARPCRTFGDLLARAIVCGFHKYDCHFDGVWRIFDEEHPSDHMDAAVVLGIFQLAGLTDGRREYGDLTAPSTLEVIRRRFGNG